MNDRIRLDWSARHRHVAYDVANGGWRIDDQAGPPSNLVPIAAHGDHRGRPLDLHRDNLLIRGDNDDALRALSPDLRGRIDLIYIDPPFNTGKDFGGYDDRLPRHLWLTMMEPRLRASWELLADHGSLYLHLDPNASHYAKVLMDELVGAERFQREIIWRIGWVSGFKTRAPNYIRNHDTILFYTKTDEFVFHKSYLPHPPGYRRRDGKPPRSPGIPMEDTWNCREGDRLDSIQIKSFSKEKTGFPTQKGEHLLKRLIEVSSNPGDRVLDFFAGSGSTAATAHKLGRRWIAVECSPTTCDIACRRLKEVVAGDDPRGITADVDWTGGGGFREMQVERDAQS